MKHFFIIAIFAILASGCHKDADTQTATLETCKLRLRMIANAKEQWAENNHKTADDIPTADDLRPYLRGAAPECPGGGKYTIGRVGEPPSCSIPEHTAYFKKAESKNGPGQQN